MITKKHCINIAKILNKNREVSENILVNFNKNILQELCDYFKSDNPKFNESKFETEVLKF